VGVGSLHGFLGARGVKLSADLHRTGGEEALVELSNVIPDAVDAREPLTAQELLLRGLIPVYSGKSIAQFNDMPLHRSGKWIPQVKTVATLSHTACHKIISRIGYYRMVLRSTCGSPKTNQRSIVACMIGPGRTATHSILAEVSPGLRANPKALVALAVINSFTPDSMIRPRVIANLSLSLLKQTSAPTILPKHRALLVHASLRLSASGVHFRPLWREQFGDTWREDRPGFTWPTLEGDDARWAVRAAIDAVVADAYGLSRDQYEHVLSTFSHASYPKAPDLCLAAFDELKAIGLESFTKKHDPYWDIPTTSGLD